MKNIILLLLVVMTQQKSNAQFLSNLDIKASTGFGTLIPIGDFGKESKPGFSTTFGIEAGNKNNFIAKFNLEASRIDYNTSFLDKGIEYKLNDKTDIFNLTFQMGFKRNIVFKNFYGYLLGGGGVSVLTAQKPTLNLLNKTLTSEDNSGRYLVAQSTLGFEYKIYKTLVFYTEVTYSKLPTTTFISLNKINTFNFQIIGFKTSF